MKTQNILAAAAGLAVGYFAFRKTDAAVGSAIIDSREESLRLAVQLGLLDLKNDYDIREAGKELNINNANIVSCCKNKRKR